MGKKSEKRIENLLANLKSTGGNISKACEGSDISRVSFYNWMNSDPEFKEAVEELQEGVCDNVESALYRSAIEGHVTAQIFFLKNKRSEDWSDRKDVYLDDLTKTPVDLNKEQIDKYKELHDE